MTKLAMVDNMHNRKVKGRKKGRKKNAENEREMGIKTVSVRHWFKVENNLLAPSHSWNEFFSGRLSGISLEFSLSLYSN